MEFVKSNLAQVEGFGFEYIYMADRDEYEGAKENKVDLQYDRLWAVDVDDKTRKQLLILNLEGGIMNCAQPLLPNTDVKFTFERLHLNV